MSEPTEPSQRLAPVIRKALEKTLATLAQEEPALIAGTQADYGHSSRVTMRRARAAIRVGRRLLGRSRADQLNEDLRWLMQIIGAVRDLDLVAAVVGTVDKRIVESRKTALHDLRRAFAGRRYKTLIQRLTDTVEDLMLVDGPPVARPAARRAHRLLQRCLDQGAMISQSSPAEAVHEFRKTVKKLRYSLDLLKPLRGALWYDNTLRSMRRFQDWLGHYQDLSVRIDVLNALGGTGIDPKQIELMTAASSQRRSMSLRFPIEFETFADTVKMLDVAKRLRRIGTSKIRLD